MMPDDQPTMRYARSTVAREPLPHELPGAVDVIYGIFVPSVWRRITESGPAFE
jgi:hypothetical protein